MRLLSRLTPFLLTAALAGCSSLSGLFGPDKNEFAPPCPRATLVQNLADVTRYVSDANHDLTGMVLQGRILAIGGECRFIERGSLTVETFVTVSAEFLRGPAMQGRATTVPLFIAVTEGNTVLDKQVIEFPVEFPPNVDRAGLVSQKVRLVLPTSKTKSPAAFGIVGGFQLTPAELATNKQRVSGR
jgi:hypothetical protein